MLGGGHSTTPSSTFDLLRGMKALPLNSTRGRNIENILRHADDLNASYDFAGREDAAFRGLAESAHAFKAGMPRMNCGIEFRPSMAKEFWDGIREFISDERRAEELGVHHMPRSYLCVWEKGKDDTVVLATLEGHIDLHGYLIVKKHKRLPQRTCDFLKYLCGFL